MCCPFCLTKKGNSTEFLLKRSPVNCQRLGELVRCRIDNLPSLNIKENDVTISSELGKVIARADKLAKSRRDVYISTEMFLLALLETSNQVRQLLEESGLTLNNLNESISAMRNGANIVEPSAEETRGALQKFTVDLTSKAKIGELDPVIGRDDEIRRAIQVLQRRTKNNPVLIGEPGVGKTAIIEGLAQRVVDGEIPEGLKKTCFISRSGGTAGWCQV